MDKVIMVGCDLHDRSMLVKVGVGREPSVKRSWSNDGLGRRWMIAELRQRASVAGATRIVFAYEASGLGFTLYDELTGAGIECHVLAPTLIERSVKHEHRKTDERDAERILGVLRAWLLAGNELPEVWVPDRQTRDDREIARARLDVADKIGRCKSQVRCLLKRNGVGGAPARPWTEDYWTWLDHLEKSVLPAGAAVSLGTLLRQLEHLEQERATLDEEVHRLSQSDRYRRLVEAMRPLRGVGPLTAMVFVTEIGDLKRFTSRQALGSFLGLTPTSYETGESDDRKGHISRQGPGRIRKVLCQAVWSRIRTDEQARAKYQRLVERNPTHRKKAVVALMRELGIAMWHKAMAALAA